mgnify:CR=1 FL=1
MEFLYNIVMHLYAFVAWVDSFFNKKVKKLVKGHRETLGLIRDGIGPNDHVVWFHAASLGEFEQGRPLIRRLKKRHPEYKILLTFFSPSGYEVRKNYEHADVICYLPFDTKRNVRKFLDAAHPEIAVFIKYEFWYFYLTQLRKRNAKIYSVSSIFREGQFYFKYEFGTKMLRQFDHMFVQNETSKRLLEEKGITCVTIAGDTRFDRVVDIRNLSADLPLVSLFKDGHKVFTAGSSWMPDEEIYLPYFNAHKDWKLIIAPHEIHAERLAKLEKHLEGRKVVRYTAVEKTYEEGLTQQAEDMLKPAEVLIVDCFGKLSSIYRYCEIALVGGGFGAGIHNVPEAAVYGVPVLFGPNNRKFREAQALKKCGGSFEFSDSDSFAEIMDRLIGDSDFLKNAGEQAGAYINNNAGAADICYKAIFGK